MSFKENLRSAQCNSYFQLVCRPFQIEHVSNHLNMEQCTSVIGSGNADFESAPGGGPSTGIEPATAVMNLCETQGKQGNTLKWCCMIRDIVIKIVKLVPRFRK